MTTPSLLLRAAALTFVLASAHSAPQTLPHTSYSAPARTPLRPTLPCQPQFLTVELPRGTRCVDYGAAFAASGGGGGPYTFALTSGALPTGLALLPNGSVLGIPGEAGASLFTVSVTGASGCATESRFAMAVTLGHRASEDQVGQSIPPAGTGGSGDEVQDTTVSTITVSNLSPLVAARGIDVRITLLHDRVGDLALTLVSPTGTRIPLATHRGGSGSHMLGASFTDAAQDSVCAGAAPFSGSYRPEREIGRHLGNGTWTLEIGDAVAGRKGRLVDWSLDFETASFEPPTSAGFAVGARSYAATLFDAPSAMQGVTLDDEVMYVTAGTSVRRMRRISAEIEWTRDFVHVEPNHPILIERSFGISPCLAFAAQDGWVYAISVVNGETVWSRNTRRVTCATDTISSAPVVQIWERSNCEFQTAIPSSDLLIVGTHAMCSTHTANRVMAINAANGNFVWTYNATGSSFIDYVTGLALDYARNQVYVTTSQVTPEQAQVSVFALDTTNGMRNWSRDLDAIDAPPIAATDCVYVVSRAGVVHKLDSDTGAVRWSLPLPIGAALVTSPVAFHESRRMLLLHTNGGVGYAVRDDGSTATIAWTSTISGHPFRSVAAAPSLDKVYFGTWSRRVYQLDIMTGSNPRFASIHSQSEPTTHVLIGDDLFGGFVEARLYAIAGERLSVLKVPWSGSSTADHGLLYGGGGIDWGFNPYVDLSITGSTTPSSRAVGQDVVDSLSVTSNHNRVADCVVVQGTLPSGMSFVGATSSQGSVSLEGDRIIARLGQLPTLDSATIHVTLRLDVAGSIPRTYDVSSEVPDPIASNDAAVLSN